jgi:hypothetical protein
VPSDGRVFAGLKAAVCAVVSEFLVKIAEIIAGIFHGRSEPRHFSVMGAEYERREARRSAAWVFAILLVLFLFGWWIWRKLTL